MVRGEAGAPTVAAGGVSVADAGWPEVTWAVAHAQRLQLAEVRFADWTWTPDIGWQQNTGQDADGLVLQLST